MPLYDFRCTSCQHAFEGLVRGDTTPPCPACGSTALERLMPLPYVKSDVTHDLAMRAARKRDKAQGTERTQEQLRYERSHND